MGQLLKLLTCQELYTLFLFNMKVGGCCLIFAVLSSAVYGSYLTSVPKAPTPTKNCRTEYETVTSYEQQCTESYEKECNTLEVNECSPRVEKICDALTFKECSTSHEERCSSEQQKHCAISYEQKCEEFVEKVCSNSYEQQCS